MVFFAGQAPTASDFNAACPGGDNQSVVNTTPGTTTATSYTSTLTGSGVVSLAFVCPPSGAIWVSYGGDVKHSTSTGFPVISVGLSGAAGTVAPSDNYQTFLQSAVAGQPNAMVFRRFWFSGLTPGSAGLITMYHKVVGAGTGTFSTRQIGVEYSPLV